MTDIAKCKQVEKILKRFQKKSKEILDNIPTCITIYKVQEDGKIILTYLNQKAEEIYNLSVSVLGKSIDEVYPEINQIGLASWIRQVHKTGQILNIPPTPWRKSHSVDDIHWFEHSICKSGDEVIVISEDVTEKVIAELNKHQNLEYSVNDIIHDFNNVLATISIATDLLSIKIKEKNLIKYLIMIKSAVKKGKNIFNKMFKSVRKNALELTPISLVEIMKNIKDFLNYLLSKKILIILEKTVEEDKILGNKNELQQVLMNLCLNAINVMPKNGLLILKLEKISGKNLKKRFKKSKQIDYFCLSISNTNTEDYSETIEKNANLYIAHDIIKSHQGFIDIENQPGRGTIFKIYLPQTEILK